MQLNGDHNRLTRNINRRSFLYQYLIPNNKMWCTLYNNGLTINIIILRYNILRCNLIKWKLLNEYSIQ